MKNLISFFLFLCLFLVVSSCTEDDSNQQSNDEQMNDSECQNNFNYTYLPESNFLDEYYNLVTAEFTNEQMESCECFDLLAIQAFRNENIINFLPFQMTPLEFDCEELQANCELNEDLDENILINEMLAPFNNALSENLILETELNLMKNFFNDFIIDNEVDFDSYWCQLEFVDKPLGLDENIAGLLSAYTLTFFQSPYDYFATIDSEYITSDNGISPRLPRWINWVTIVATRSKLGVFKKYVDSMGVLIEGALDGQDSSYEALCTALD